jgi:lysozyme
MELSAQGLDLIKRSEGFRSRQYLDLAGYETIGYGHRIAPRESFPESVTEAQAAEILMSDVKKAEQAVARLVHVPLTQGQFDALIDFCFNMGAGRLAASTLLKELNAGHYAQAGLQLLRWDCAAGAPIAGLKARRTAELQLWTGGEPADASSARGARAEAAISGESRAIAQGTHCD